MATFEDIAGPRTHRAPGGEGNEDERSVSNYLTEEDVLRGVQAVEARTSRYVGARVKIVHESDSPIDPVVRNYRQ